ncbi:hypothetical protein GYMLUDRAFT_642978 [Collybiopsis luxurians FD-317 M1]|nr:hypothetical protein GYMLUDRAFT_642978 [Collybiopsis luxurians FD-317 M1]
MISDRYSNRISYAVSSRFTCGLPVFSDVSPDLEPRHPDFSLYVLAKGKKKADVRVFTKIGTSSSGSDLVDLITRERIALIDPGALSLSCLFFFISFYFSHLNAVHCAIVSRM